MIAKDNPVTARRIAFVTNIIPPYRVTFYQKLCRRVPAEWLVIRGRSIVGAGRTGVDTIAEVPEIVIENHECRIGPLTLRWQSGALAAVRKFHPELLILLGISGTISNWILLVWAKVNRVPVLMWACGWESQKPNSCAFQLKRFIAVRYFGAADQLLLYSSKGADYLAQLLGRQSNIDICYNGIEIDALQKTEGSVRARAAALRGRCADDTVVILFVGAMLEEKRIDLLLMAYENLARAGSNVRLWLVGDGPERARLERLAADITIGSVTFYGRIVEQVDEYFAAADIVVLPGLGGLALNQAMFWERPCIVSEADGTEDDLIVDGESGLRFAPGDEMSLTRALRALCARSPNERAAMGRKARERIEGLSNVNIMVKTFSSTIETILHRNRE